MFTESLDSFGNINGIDFRQKRDLLKQKKEAQFFCASFKGISVKISCKQT